MTTNKKMAQSKYCTSMSTAHTSFTAALLLPAYHPISDQTRSEIASTELLYCLYYREYVKPTHGSRRLFLPDTAVGTTVVDLSAAYTRYGFAPCQESGQVG